MILQKFYIQTLKLFNSKKVFFYNPKYSKWIFLLLLILVSLFYQYHKILFLRPQGVHQWRQADCISFTMNYYKEGMHFFNPSIHNLISDNGTSGLTMGEFPALYYFNALLWKIFGPHEFICRLVNMLITFLGLFALFKIFEDVLKDSFWAIGLSLLFFTSPMYVYYSSNFLTNAPAFSLVLIAWYFFYQFYKNEKLIWLFGSLMILLLAALLKITASISFILLLFLFFIELFKLYKFKNGRKIFNKPQIQFIPFLIVLIGIVGWYYYTSIFNNIHGGKFTFNDLWPLWRMDAQEIKITLEGISMIWIYEYFNRTILYIALVLFIVNLFLYKKINKFLWISTLVIFTGVFLYLIFWFNALKNHDYYLINLLILLVSIFLSFFCYLRKTHFKVFNSLILKFVFLVFLISNIDYCEEHIRGRFSGWMNERHLQHFQALETITPYLRSLGIERTDKVISIPDISFNITLYLMDQKGWTDYGDINLNRSEKIAKKIKLGAEYLIINDSTIYKEDNIQPYIKNKIGSYKNIDIYDLRNL